VLHDLAEAFFTFSICTHKCDLIYAFNKNMVFSVLMFTELTNVRTGSCAGLNGFMCRFEQVQVQVGIGSCAGLNRFMCRFEQVHVQD
jgi:hypothetical protein